MRNTKGSAAQKMTLTSISTSKSTADRRIASDQAFLRSSTLGLWSALELLWLLLEPSTCSRLNTMLGEDLRDTAAVPRIVKDILVAGEVRSSFRPSHIMIPNSEIAGNTK